MRLQGNKIIVTGSTSGIGGSISQKIHWIKQ
jgi:short-subunit dehydrogenase involved in D-alanine esterification of teichoic acids